MSHSQHEDCSVVAVADDLFASDGEFAPSDDRDSLMHIYDSFVFLCVPLCSCGFLWVPLGSFGFLWVPVGSFGFHLIGLFL